MLLNHTCLSIPRILNRMQLVPLILPSICHIPNLRQFIEVNKQFDFEIGPIFVFPTFYTNETYIFVFSVKSSSGDTLSSHSRRKIPAAVVMGGEINCVFHVHPFLHLKQFIVK